MVAVLGAAASPARGEDAADLWKLLENSPSEAPPWGSGATDSNVERQQASRRQGDPDRLDESSELKQTLPPPAGAPKSRKGLAELGRKLALGMNAVRKETWLEANLNYEFDKGWIRSGNQAWKDVMRGYVCPEREISVLVSFCALAEGETAEPEEICLRMVRRGFTTAGELKQIQAEGRAAELGMWVQEGSATSGPNDRWFLTVGRTVRNGAVYGVCALAKDKEKARAEFTRFVNTMAWIKPDKNLAVKPIAELSVSGAGFVIPCEGSLLAACPPEQPYSSAATRLDRRLEITAFDVRGCELPLREMAVSFLEVMAISAGDNHVIEERKVGGIAGLRAKPKRATAFLGRELDWQMDFALREGRLCVALGYWYKGSENDEKLHQELVSRIRFSKPEGEPRKLASDGEKLFASMFYNGVGLQAFQRGQYNASTKAFGTAAELNATDANIAMNLVNSLTQQGRIKNALAAVEKSRKHIPDHQGIKQWHAGLLARSGSDARASELYEELFKHGLRDQAELSLWLESLHKLGKHDRAVEVARAVFDETGQIAWRRMLANCLWTAGKPDEALGHYQEMSADLGEEAVFAADHASLLLETKDYQAVLDLVGRWEKEREAPAAMLFSKGMAQTAMGWFKEAAATFTRLDGMVPGNQTVKEALAHAQAMMGRGSHEGIRDDLTEVEMPELLRQNAARALSEAKIDEMFPGEGSVTLEDVRVWHWREGGDAKVTHRQRIRVLGASGVQAYSTLYIPFKPVSERININRMTVTDKQGRQIASFRREEMYVRDTNGQLADGEKIACLPVPTLEEGSLIEFVHTKTLLGTAERFPMAIGGVPEHNPLVYGAVAFTGDLDKMTFAHTGRVRAAGDETCRVFEGSLLKRRKGGSHLPPYDQWGMMCWAADKRATWEEETRIYLEEIRDCLEDESFAGKVVEDLGLAGKKPEEITRIVVRWLNEKFQYQGLEFGRRARIPAKGETTLARGFGDCKDLSLMVRGILRKAGVKANLALVNSSGILREDLPSLDQFDHMVVHLPEMGGTILDATMRYFNTPEALGISALSGRAYVIEGERPGFTPMNELAGTERLVTVERQIEIDPENGETRTRETVEMSPAEASVMRYALSMTAGAEHLKTMETMMRRKEPRLELKRFKASDLSDPFKPLRMELEYVVGGAFQSDGGVLSGSVPGAFERWMFELDQERDRDIGMRIAAAERCVVRNRIVPPKGYQWLPPAELRREAKEPGSFEGGLTWKSGTEEILMDGALRYVPSQGDAALYQRVWKANDLMFRLFSERLRFRAELAP